MSKLEKRLAKMLEVIDLNNVDQVRSLKNLAVYCKKLEFAAKVRMIERAIESGKVVSIERTKKQEDKEPSWQLTKDADVNKKESDRLKDMREIASMALAMPFFNEDQKKVIQEVRDFKPTGNKEDDDKSARDLISKLKEARENLEK